MQGASARNVCKEMFVEDLEVHLIFIKTHKIRLPGQDLDSKVGFLKEEFIKQGIRSH